MLLRLFHGILTGLGEGLASVAHLHFPPLLRRAGEGDYAQYLHCPAVAGRGGVSGADHGASHPDLPPGNAA